MFECRRVYTSGFGHTDGSENHSNYQAVKVYQKTEGTIYRRGIKVGGRPNLIYDYEFQYANINEDRTAQNISCLDYAFCDMLGQLENEEWVKSVLRTAQNDKDSVEYLSTAWHTPDQPPSLKWVDFSRENMLVVKEISGKYIDEISRTKKEVFLLRSSFAKHLKKMVPAVAILGLGSQIGDTFFSEVEKTPKMEFLLKEVLSSLKEMDYEVHFDIFVADFEDDNMLGYADIKEKKIYIAKKTFDMGRRELAMTIMEENEHIISGKEDETRAFQNHIFSQWLKTMEDKNGLFL